MKSNLVLHLVLSYHWYDEIHGGNKYVEYRVMSDHWRKLIWDRRKEITNVCFQRGYAQHPNKMTFEVDSIDIGKCPYDGWDDLYYRIHFKPIEFYKLKVV